MVSSFKEEIVPGWRRKTREAWRDNRVFDVKDRKLFIQIRGEITKGLVDHMFTFFGRVSDPTQKHIREIIEDLLVKSYPWMFSKGKVNIYRNVNSIYTMISFTFTTRFLNRNV